ncbi:MAG: sigma factor, partial [Pirellulales bacterium]
MKDVARSNDDSAASLPPEDASRKEEGSAAPGAADSQAEANRLDLPAGDDPSSAEGGLPSLAELIETFHAPLYRYAFRLTGQTADAEDLTQQAFLVAQRKRHQIREAER